jgi:hypothetical protein
MNKSDFQRASGGKKVKFTFSIVLTKGRLTGIINPPPLAKDLVAILQEDSVANKFLRQNELEFTMNSNFQLQIKNNTPAAEPELQVDETIAAVEEVNSGDAPAVTE